jgi:endo-1,4-beta-xylanase
MSDRFILSPRHWLITAFVVMSAVFSCTAQNLLLNPGFEAGTGNWSGWGPVTFTSSTVLPHTGSRSALVENRTDPWNGVAQPVTGILQSAITYRISAWVRLVSGNNQNVILTIRKVDGNGTSYAAVASGTASSTNWTQLIGTYTLNVSGTLTNLYLYMEGPAAGVSFYADDFLIEAYDWKSEANARIEQIRKRDARLLIVDTAGNPVPGTSVAIRQTKHRFAFGSAINGNISNPNYAAFFRTNFEWAVMENESKWYANEPSRSNVTYTVANSITNFCYTNGITLRGHTLFWAVDRFVQPWVTNLSSADLLVHLTNRINSAVNHFKGTFQHWDVNNELFHGNYFGNRLGNWVNSWMFQHARSQDTNVQLFVNDYSVVSGNQTDAYKQQILDLIASNAPVGGIGAQGHFGATVNPLLTEARLDSLAELGLPIWITEYDSVNTNEFIRADNLEMLYRIAFSKPAVDGVLMWGFWAGSHWLGSNAAIVNLNWTLNAAGQRYQSLLTEWTTITNGATGAGGEFDFHGFHGSYDITLSPPGGQPTLRRITLDPGAGTNVVTLIAHSGGAKPVLHHLALLSANGPFGFQLTGDAGRTFAIQTSTNLSITNWITLTNLFNPNGTIWFTNSSTLPQQFFRAGLLP